MKRRTIVPHTAGEPMKYNIAEKFISINGEGMHAGQLAVFIRFCGCNLNCSYCDTSWANSMKAPFEVLDENQILLFIKKTGVINVTLTGGEPLIQEGMHTLLEKLAHDKEIHVEVETNGSVDISQFFDLENRPSFTVDYKLPGSGMEQEMYMLNFRNVTKKDTIKFVVSDSSDLKKAGKVIKEFELAERSNVYLSPVFGRIEPEEIVDFLKENTLNKVNLQLQLHKIIWDPDKKGV